MKRRDVERELFEAEEDGVRARIFKQFFWPLFRSKPESVQLKHHLEETIFHLSERHIDTYRAIESFTMPGLYRSTMLLSGIEIGPRKVHKGAKLIVRHDDTIPDRFEVETYIGQGHKEAHFLLTAAQWLDIRINKLARAKFGKQKIEKDEN